MVKLTFVVEDTQSAHKSLKFEHGLSIFVQTPDSSFLFDTGATWPLGINAGRLNIDLAKMDFVVISHAHYDHAGSFPNLLKKAKIPALYTGRDFFQEKYSYDKEEEKYTYLGTGFGTDLLKKHGVEHIVCDDILPLGENAWLVGNFPRRFAFETIPAHFVVGEEKVADDFHDEIALVVKEGDGLAVITGCAHPGILNMTFSIAERFQKPIKSVIGGTHLAEADEARIDKTLDEFIRMGVKRIGLCHCSGEKVYACPDKLAGAKIKATRPRTGDIIVISGEN